MSVTMDDSIKRWTAKRKTARFTQHNGIGRATIRLVTAKRLGANFSIHERARLVGSTSTSSQQA